jgi:hypothetical protein
MLEIGANHYDWHQEQKFHFARQRKGQRKQHRNRTEISYQKYKNDLKIVIDISCIKRLPLNVELYNRDPIQKIRSFHFLPVLNFKILHPLRSDTRQIFNDCLAFTHDFEEICYLDSWLVHLSIHRQCTRCCVTYRKQDRISAFPGK